MIFEDITTQYQYESLKHNYESLKDEHEKLVKDNQGVSKIRKIAQEQAVKMALLNKVSNSIRKHMDLSDIINSTFSEFSELFGAAK